MSEIPEPTGDTPLIVEERLHSSLLCLACLRRIAHLALEPCGIPLLGDLTAFARVTRQFAKAAERHLRAIKLALPTSATNLDAPSGKEGL